MNSNEFDETQSPQPDAQEPQPVEEITPNAEAAVEEPAPVEDPLPNVQPAPPESEAAAETGSTPANEEAEAAAEVTGEAAEAAAPPPKPGIFKRFMAFLFNPETRFGRFNRAFLRGALVVLVLFGLGFLTSTLVLYQPANQALMAARAEIVTMGQQAEENAAQAQRASAELETSSSQVGEMEATLQARDTRIQLLVLQNQIAEARLALAEKNGPVVLQLLNSARETLKPLVPLLRPMDNALVDSLEMRLDLAANELIRDPETAMADLELLASALELLDKKMGN